jgi:NADH-quinone oxidoreductase subunit G
MHADIDVNEPTPPDDPDSPLSFSMEGYQGDSPPALITRYWKPHWNSVQALNKFQQEVDGPLRGGPPGVRLLVQSPDGEAPYFEEIPAAFVAREGEWLAVPCHHVFGSEPLSMRSPGVQQLAPQPYVRMNPRDVEMSEVKGYDRITLAIAGTEYSGAIHLDDRIPNGVVGVPIGLPEMPALDLPAWCRVEKAADLD